MNQSTTPQTKLSLSRAEPSSSERVETQPTVVIEPTTGLFSLGLRDVWNYRDLVYFLVWRDVKTRYAQSILGIGWAVIQPVFSMIVFTIVFGNLAKISSDGVPYAIFSYTALVPWTYFSNALTNASGSLNKNSTFVQKIYFPRLIIPLVPVLGKLIDFAIAFLLLFVLMFWFGIAPTIWIVTLPFLIVLMMLTAAGMGMFLTALAIQYRDVNYGMGFAVQLMMYATPVVYPTSLIPEPYRLLYALNPIVGVVEGFRASLLGSVPMPWDFLAIGCVTSVLLFIGGALYFRRKERIFADVA